jgi:YVTN family beta-propeller protein
MRCHLLPDAGRRYARICCAILVLAAGLGHAAPFAYISNKGGANVSVIDTATNTVIATVPVGTSPWGVAVNPVLHRVYVANNGSNSISVINTDTQTVVATVPVGTLPVGVAVRPDGTRAYVTNFLDSSVSVIDTSSNTVVDTIILGLNADGPRGIDVQSDGSFAYTANETGNSVSQINLVTRDVATQGIAGIMPFDVRVSPDGTRTYVSLTGQCSVQILGAGATSVALFPPAPPAPCSTPGTGMVLDPISGLVYVGVQIGVKVIQGTTLLAFYSAVGTSRGIGVHPSGGRLYGVNTTSNTVTVINQFGGAAIATVPVGTSPQGLGNFVSPITAPLAPTIGIATPGNGLASIAFTAPASEEARPSRDTPRPATRVRSPPPAQLRLSRSRDLPTARRTHAR